MAVVRTRRRLWQMFTLILALPALMMMATGVAAHGTDICASGLPNVRRWYGVMRTYDPSRAPDLVTGASSGWHEQNYEVYDYGDGGFVGSILWAQQDPGRIWVEIGYFADRRCLPSGWATCFFKAWNNTNQNAFRLETFGPPAFNPEAWHRFKLVYNSVTGAWDSWIDDINLGGWVENPRLVVIDNGIEITNTCSVAHTTRFGSPDPNHPYAFMYRVGIDGWWTSWGSGDLVDTPFANDPPMHASWLDFATHMQAWGP